MDAGRFDGLTRALGRRPSRRAVVAGLLAGALGAAPAGGAAPRSGPRVTVCFAGDTLRVAARGWARRYPGASLGPCPGMCLGDAHCRPILGCNLGYCGGGRCVALTRMRCGPPPCAGAGAACGGDGECCSGVCRGGAGGGACARGGAGRPCRDDGDCRSGRCDEAYACATA